jgi:hypothetical protein
MLCATLSIARAALASDIALKINKQIIGIQRVRLRQVLHRQSTSACSAYPPHRGFMSAAGHFSHAELNMNPLCECLQPLGLTGGNFPKIGISALAFK